MATEDFPNLDLDKQDLVKYTHKLYRAIAIYKENGFSFNVSRDDPQHRKKSTLLRLLKNYTMAVGVQRTITEYAIPNYSNTNWAPKLS
jgi:hypothetical protein